MKKIFFGYLILAGLYPKAQITPFEKSDGKETATYFEAIDWYKKLDKKSSVISIKTMGGTDSGYPLHLVMVSSDKKFDPIQWHQQGKAVILINNGIHPGEPDGIDASMMLVRDMINKKIILPKNVAIGIIPVYNIGGCLNRNSYTRVNQNGPIEYGFRGNSQNLDLNRDFTKCDSNEARSFTEIFHYLNPDILIDNHVSDGADFQHTMTLISTQYNKLGPTLGNWLREIFEPKLYQSMSAKGWDMIPYVNFETTDFDKGMRMFMDPPRYSSGYASLFNTLAFMPETHMLKPYKKRVQSTYDLMQTFIEQAGIESLEIKKIRVIATKELMKQKEYPLKWFADSSIFSEITFKGYQTKFNLSEATGLQKMIYDHQQPFTKKIKFYYKFLPGNIIESPKSYIIPQGWHEVIDLLRRNNVKFHQLSNDTILSLNAYQIQDYKSYPNAYEKHHKNYAVKVLLEPKVLRFLKGDFIINVNQPTNRYIVEMLEPTGDDSFFAWNFFDAILQQKEGYSNYRWEEIAADLLKKDSSLKEKIKAKRESDLKFNTDSGAILDFIYKNSAFYEKAFLQYPVYRIEY